MHEREPDNTDWMAEAACKGLTHLFFPAPAESPKARERREASARMVCGSCAVRSTCLDYAREHHEYGIWGGETEDERHDSGYKIPNFKPPNSVQRKTNKLLLFLFSYALFRCCFFNSFFLF